MDNNEHELLRPERVQCIHMLSVTERAVYGASMSAVPELSLNSKIVGLLTLKRPEGRAPTSRQLRDAPQRVQPLVETTFFFRFVSIRVHSWFRSGLSQTANSDRRVSGGKHARESENIFRPAPPGWKGRSGACVSTRLGQTP